MIDRLMDFIGQYVLPLMFVMAIVMFFALLGCAFGLLLGWIT